MSTAQGHSSFGQRVVLCIDDDQDVLGVLRDFLMTFGDRIVTATDPEEVFKLLLNSIRTLLLLVLLVISYVTRPASRRIVNGQSSK
jgi:DNA-binding response OmpR family regulator